MARLLIIEDDRFLVRAMEKLFSAEGYYCKSVASGSEARQALLGDPYDLILLDVGLPDTDGFALCRQIRTRHRMPVIFLSARSEEGDKVVGLEVGGDDYLAKPFAPRELVARVRAHLRRSGEYSLPAGAANEIRLGNMVVDIDKRDALCNGRLARLTEREFELLLFLARHRDKALATEWIFENVWGYDAELGVKTLAVYVRRVRQKIETDPNAPFYLRTVRGFGYKLTAEELP